jgi:hypothetical protein
MLAAVGAAVIAVATLLWPTQRSVESNGGFGLIRKSQAKVLAVVDGLVE